MHILLIEDDDRVAAALRPALHRHGMTTTRLAVGRGAVDHLRDIDIVLLDLGLPDIDGFKVCRAIREVSEVPIIVVTARGEVGERVHGLNVGADDYVLKPYDIDELVARMHAVYRRRRTAGSGSPAGASDVVTIDDVVIDMKRHVVTVQGAETTLSRKEFDVLAVLARSGAAVCTRERIIAEVWGETWPGANRTLDVHIATCAASSAGRRSSRPSAGSGTASTRPPPSPPTPPVPPTPGGRRAHPAPGDRLRPGSRFSRPGWGCRSRSTAPRPRSSGCSPTASPTPSTTRRSRSAPSPRPTRRGEGGARPLRRRPQRRGHDPRRQRRTSSRPRATRCLPSTPSRRNASRSRSPPGRRRRTR
ncbi:response regulator [Pseudonocardia sp. ICBG601]|uniref:response regulator transcription factor n=1 Tax=Pseudonocardia sp. ICBG601 TaxID=2846759 RepID=UPI0027E26E42|nr:response regulator [Pseudonocardia sp. ICBG601]